MTTSVAMTTLLRGNFSCPSVQ
ncbi:MAG: hypothetical protein QOE55_5140, partial [Acidobacteriaceae bacterium]|nr:hypothetical protein [Acidobacteriaceae bacterium]